MQKGINIMFLAKFEKLTILLVLVSFNPSFGKKINFPERPISLSEFNDVVDIANDDDITRKPVVGIIGGTTASAGELPYQVAIVYPSGSILCGGSLIHKNFVLTAAHCFIRSFKTLNVLAGALGIYIEEETWQIRSIDRFVRHPRYNARRVTNDIAVILCKTPFDLNSDVQLIPMYRNPTYPTGSVIISGWGETNNGSPEFLQKATVEIVPYSDCLASYGKLPQFAVCASAPGTDTCQGDSGGPLAQDGLLVGITSYGIGCADPNYPGVYTFVAAYVSWVEKTMVKYTPKNIFEASELVDYQTFNL